MVYETRLAERDQSYINAALDGTTPEVPARIKVSDHQYLNGQREALAQEIRDDRRLSPADRTQALIAVYTNSPTGLVFRPDPQLRMDVLRFHLDALRLKIGHSWSQLRAATIQAVGEHVDTSPTAGQDHTSATDQGTDRASSEQGTTARQGELIEWLGRLPNRVNDERGAAPTVSRIMSEMNRHLEGLPVEAQDRALLITAEIVRDTHRGIDFTDDPRALMALDDESFDMWIDQRRPAAGADHAVEQVDASLTAASCAQPHPMVATAADDTLTEPGPVVGSDALAQPAVVAGM
ncbi:hypothetical protein [Nocardia asiatica]|uniref:hypothetical protein n=1 Tax=Nocardia asiatica TaxID=209252 RepID=UPI0012FCA3AE|nr:hypothetical protein [Nocardia asiatica]